jgi:hypothetical protein
MVHGIQTFQNAGQNGSFYYYENGSKTSTWLVLMLAIILLIALLCSERRYRALRERFALVQVENWKK